MTIPWRRFHGYGGDGKISNQDENWKPLKYLLGKSCWRGYMCFLTLLLTGAPYLSDDDEKTLQTAECYRPSCAAPSFISTSDLHPLLRFPPDRKAEQKAASLPAWLPGRQLGSAISHHKPSWDILISEVTGGYCFGGISIVLSGIKMKSPEILVQHLGTCLSFIY